MNERRNGCRRPQGLPTSHAVQLSHYCSIFNCLHTEWMDLDARELESTRTYDCAHRLDNSTVAECINADGSPVAYNYKSPSEEAL